MSNSWKRFDEIFGIQKSLDETTEKYKCRLEYTLTYPRTKPFLRMSVKEQSCLFENLLFYFEMPVKAHIVNKNHYFEPHMDGNLHCHGYVDLEFENNYCPVGLVMECVKSCLFQYPKRTHSQLTSRYYSYKFNVWKSPAILCAYIDFEEKKRINDWDNYIKKLSQV